MASNGLSDGSMRSEEFRPMTSSSPTFSGRISTVTVTVSPLQRLGKKSQASSRSKIGISTSTGLSIGDESPEAQRSCKASRQRQRSEGRTQPAAHTPADAFQNWLRAKEEAASRAKRMKKLMQEDQKRKEEVRDQLNRAALQCWREVHEAKLREKQAAERSLKQLERQRRAEEAHRSLEREHLCQLHYRQWVKEKCSGRKPTDMSQFIQNLAEKMQNRKEDEDIPAIPEISSENLTPQSRQKLSLETFGVSIAANSGDSCRGK